MKQIIIVSMLCIFIIGCNSVPEPVPQCEPEIVEKIVEKEVIVEKIIDNLIIRDKECNVTAGPGNESNLDVYNVTLPYVLRIKHLDRQLDECLFSNSSCHNKSLNYKYATCERELNYTKNMIDEWIDYVQ